jgi:hypothetical protein
MKQAKKVLTVPSNGQISIGKTWAGRQVQIEEVDDHQILITSGTFIPAGQDTFFTEGAEAQLKDFNKWSTKNPPKKTDLKRLRKRLGR